MNCSVFTPAVVHIAWNLYLWEDLATLKGKSRGGIISFHLRSTTYVHKVRQSDPVRKEATYANMRCHAWVHGRSIASIMSNRLTVLVTMSRQVFKKLSTHCYGPPPSLAVFTFLVTMSWQCFKKQSTGSLLFFFISTLSVSISNTVFRTFCCLRTSHTSAFWGFTEA